MYGRRVVKQFLLHRVAVKPSNGAKSSRDRGSCSTASFEVTTETFDIGAPRLKETDVVLFTPSGKLAQVKRIRISCQPAVASQISGQRELFCLAECRLGDDDCGRGLCGVHDAPPGRAETRDWVYRAPAMLEDSP